MEINEKMKNFYISVMITLLLFVNNSQAQSSREDNWSLHAHFRVMRIEEISSKYKLWKEQFNEENRILYHISVELMDSGCFQQLADVYGNKKTFKGTRFSIISVDSGFVCDKLLIKKNDVISLTISLWSRIWFVGDPLPGNSLWPYEICGYNIPLKILHSQPMKAEELKGLYYSHNSSELNY